MSWTSYENREPGVEHKKNAETVEREQIAKHQHANGVKGGPTTPSRGSAYNTGGETQRVLPADMEGVNVETGRIEVVHYHKRLFRMPSKQHYLHLLKRGKR